MSCKLNNSIRLNSGDPQQWVKAPGDSNVKLAGEEAKDRLYEPKHKKKLVRVLTVVAYVFFVSLAAIMLSLYYVFLWNGHPSDTAKKSAQKTFTCPHEVADIPFEPTAIPVLDAATTSPALPAMVLTNNLDTFVREDRNDSMPPGNFSEVYALSKRSPLLQKLVFKNLAD